MTQQDDIYADDNYSDDSGQGQLQTSMATKGHQPKQAIAAAVATQHNSTSTDNSNNSDSGNSNGKGSCLLACVHMLDCNEGSFV